VAVTLSLTNSVSPEETIEQGDTGTISIWKLPKLLWVGLAVFSMNIVVGAGILATPEVQTDLYGKEVQDVSTKEFPKPSPFDVTIETAKHKVRLAEKLYPSAFTVSAARPAQPVSLDTGMPVRTEPAVYTPGSQPAIYNTDRHYEVQRVMDLTPRRTAESDGKFGLIN
jgi:hypothetical protein